MNYIYSADVRGSINGTDVLISGSGIFQQDSGIVEGTYALEAVPIHIDPLIFNAVLVTGYPSVCQAREGVRNPFRPGSYSYRREVNLGRSGWMAYSAECEERTLKGGNKILESKFRIEGSVSVPRLVRTEPLTEHWVSSQPGRVDGTFAIRWLTSTGTHVTGIAATKYVLPKADQILAYPVQRRIELRNTVGQGLLTVHQVSSLQENAHSRRI
jgi:hypothetical protein